MYIVVYNTIAQNLQSKSVDAAQKVSARCENEAMGKALLAQRLLEKYKYPCFSIDHIPFDWKNDFSADYLCDIRCIRLIMSENCIRRQFEAIKLDRAFGRAALNGADPELVPRRQRRMKT